MSNHLNISMLESQIIFGALMVEMNGSGGEDQDQCEDGDKYPDDTQGYRYLTITLGRIHIARTPS